MLTRRSLTAAGAVMLARPAFAKPGHIRPDLYGWEGGRDPVPEFTAAGLPASGRMAPENEPGERFILTGRVLSWDRGVPVAGVMIAAYQTNAGGIYERVADPEGVQRIRLRGSVTTDREGRYAFHTIKPGIYPSRAEAAHIHMTVFEPGRRPYWIDNVVFQGEAMVDASYLRKQDLRGGSGIVRLTRTPQGVWTGARDIRLERHPA